MSWIPETPEGVALVLFLLALDASEPPSNRARTAWMLDLYAECLRTAEGERPADRRRAAH